MLVGLCAYGLGEYAVEEAARNPLVRNQPWHAQQGVNVREGPGTEFPVVYSLSVGDLTYPGTPNADGWAPVMSGPAVSDTVGWVLRRLLVTGNPPDLLLLSHQWDPGGRYESASVVGEIQNLSGSTLGYVSITCNLFDSQDRQVGTAFTNTTGLANRSVWRFQAYVLEDDARYYRCEAPEGF